MVKVTVEATWRMSRVEFNQPYSSMGMVTGYGEVLLAEAEGTTPEADAMLRPKPFGIAPASTGKEYGTMMGAQVSRSIAAVKDETVDIDGKTISFAEAMTVMETFLLKWQAEDASKPPMPLPEAAAPTPMPGGGEKPRELW